MRTNNSYLARTAQAFTLAGATVLPLFGGCVSKEPVYKRQVDTLNQETKSGDEQQKQRYGGSSLKPGSTRLDTETTTTDFTSKCAKAIADYLRTKGNGFVLEAINRCQDTEFDFWLTHENSEDVLNVNSRSYKRDVRIKISDYNTDGLDLTNAKDRGIIADVGFVAGIKEGSEQVICDSKTPLNPDQKKQIRQAYREAVSLLAKNLDRVDKYLRPDSRVLLFD